MAKKTSKGSERDSPSGFNKRPPAKAQLGKDAPPPEASKGYGSGTMGLRLLPTRKGKR